MKDDAVSEAVRESYRRPPGSRNILNGLDSGLRRNDEPRPLTRHVILPRSSFILLNALLLPVGATAADQYPSRPVRFIVGQPAGGNADMTARVYGQKLGERLGVQFVVDNRGGGGGVIATELVVRSQPDGYTLFVAHTAVGTNPALIAKLPFDTRRDLAPISLLTVSPNIVVIAAGNSIKSIGDLIAAARARPGKINYASSGVATSTHVSGELFKAMAKVDMQHVA